MDMEMIQKKILMSRKIGIVDLSGIKGVAKGS